VGTAVSARSICHRKSCILGEYDKALAAIREAWNLNPENALVLSNIVNTYLQLNRSEEALASAREAQARHLDNPFIHASLYRVDFLRHDAGATELMGKPGREGGREDLTLSYQSDTAAYTGQLAKARD
jgi:tetratricopeptide (TPR) repeat protein